MESVHSTTRDHFSPICSHFFFAKFWLKMLRFSVVLHLKSLIDPTSLRLSERKVKKISAILEIELLLLWNQIKLQVVDVLKRPELFATNVYLWDVFNKCWYEITRWRSYSFRKLFSFGFKKSINSWLWAYFGSKFEIKSGIWKSWNT